MSTNDQQETVPFYGGERSDLSRDKISVEIAGNGAENPYKRVKWTEDMVKLLITVKSYIDEYDAAFPDNSVAKNGGVFIPKTGKWRVVSDVLIKRGYHVSPHQCEDKFNDLNKKYRRLNEILGRGTACQVVKNPNLVGSMDLSSKEIAEVMKILNCKHLFYSEMCSFNNHNRLFLPHDQSVLDLLKLVLVKGKGNCLQDVIHENPTKIMKQGEKHGVAGTNFSLNCNRTEDYISGKREKILGMNSRLLEFEKQKLQIQEQTLEVEKLILVERQKEDLELEKMRLENKMIKLENQRLALEIREQMIKRKVYF